MKLPRVSAVVAAAVLAPAVLFPSTASAADAPQPTGIAGPDTASGSAPDATPAEDADGQEQRDRAEIQRILADKETGPGVREAASKALQGTAAQMRHFLAVELPRLRAADNQVKVAQILSSGGRAVREAARKALNGSDEDVATFLKVGWPAAQAEDDRVAVLAVLADKSISSYTAEAAQKALNGTPADLAHFLTVELPRLRADDNRVKVARIMSTGGPAVREAAGKALDGGYEAVLAFLDAGWAKARAVDEAAANKPADKPEDKPADKPDGKGAGSSDGRGAGQQDQGAQQSVQPAALTGTGTADTTGTSVTTGSATTGSATAVTTAAGGTLAATGTDGLGWEAGGAAAALAAGAALVAVSRRRTSES
ncbi:ALF repeat-containing protein [Kitasatospora sp. NPDC048194]|uniref:ALF repeat-containing protein n=1 Tax=Kitasatospora sp. NPDC048194 TaxID=3364045 RepID=UPI0037163D8A